MRCEPLKRVHAVKDRRLISPRLKAFPIAKPARVQLRWGDMLTRALMSPREDHTNVVQAGPTSKPSCGRWRWPLLCMPPIPQCLFRHPESLSGFA